VNPVEVVHVKVKLVIVQETALLLEAGVPYMRPGFGRLSVRTVPTPNTAAPPVSDTVTVQVKGLPMVATPLTLFVLTTVS
jgi:hypothetical protein